MSRRSTMAGLALACLALPALMAADAPAYPKPVQKELYADDVRGKPAPPFSVGAWLTAEPDRKGKVVLIDFWATWCPPCRATIPELNDLQAKFRDDLVVIGVSDEPVDTLRPFMRNTKMDYAVATDPDKKMNSAIHVAGIPHVLLISTDGVVRWQGFPLSDTEPLTADLVKQVIAADPVWRDDTSDPTGPPRRSSALRGQARRADHNEGQAATSAAGSGRAAGPTVRRNETKRDGLKAVSGPPILP